MARKFTLAVEEGRSVQDTADQIALLTSAVLNELFPEQWREAMVLLSQRINRAVAEDDLGNARHIAREKPSADRGIGGLPFSLDCGD